jgi:hypothetical protein
LVSIILIRLSIEYRVCVILACTLYLIVSFKDPGYVKDYVPRENDDLERDLER